MSVNIIIFILLIFISQKSIAGTHVQTTSTSAVDNSIARMDGTSGEIIQKSTAVIDDNGNLGIGTNSPVDSLQIIDSDGEETLDVLTNSGSYHSLKVSGAGTVGIGTNFPDNSLALDVNGPTTIHNGSLVLRQNNAAVDFRVIDLSGNTGFAVNSPSFGSTVTSLYNVGIGTAANITDAKLMVLGNVGIGTFHPGTAIDVQGTIRATALNIGIGTSSPTRLCISNNLVLTCP